MKEEQKTYILFPSHTDGIALEKVLKQKGIRFTIVPTPRDLSKCCGISIMLNPDDQEEAEKLIKEHGDIKVEGIHTIKRKKRNWFG